jgi:hypothetical protein
MTCPACRTEDHYGDSGACRIVLMGMVDRLEHPRGERAVELWGDVSLTLTPEQWKARAA